MAESVLSKLVKTDIETKEHLESIESTLGKVYKLQLKTEKRESKEAKREAQRRKRKGGDFLRDLKLPEKEKKKAKKGFFESLGEFFKNLGGGLLSGLGGLIGPLFKANGPIAGAITTFFKTLFSSTGAIFKALSGAVVKLIKNPAFLAATTTVIAIDKGVKDQKSGYDQSVQEENNRRKKKGQKPMTTEEETKYLTDLITKQGLLAGGGLPPGVQAMLKAQQSKRGWAQSKEIVESLEKSRGKGIFGTTHQIMGEEVEGETRDLAVATRNIMSHNDEIYRLRKSLVDMQEGSEDYKKAQAEIAKHEKAKIRWRIKQHKAALAYDAMVQAQETPVEPVQKQTGGPLTVPGTGSGDKVPMMLPSGSFVMNRNAAAMGFQDGGMIPTLLEPGEHVYGPGQWNASHVMMNNQIPRFQTGGVVEASHPETGPGWSVGKDQYGRPAVFSKPAAEALMKAIQSSGGAVKPSDITSSTRTQAKNAAVGGVPNSNHLRGNAVDIHGTSKVWLKEHGQKYGWKNLVYSGHDGHFDFTGGGSLPVPGDGRENTSDSTDNKTGGGMQSMISSLGKIGGGMGEFVSGALGIVKDAFGPELGVVLDSIFGSASSMISGGGGGNDTGGTSSVGAKPSEVELAKNLMKDMGITKEAAAAIVGNLSYESAGLAPNIREGMTYGNSWPAGKTQVPAGYGWAQWSFGRHDEFVNKHLGGFGGPGGGSKREATAEDNYKWLLHEFRNKEPITGMPMDDVAGATHWFRSKWERAEVPADSKRLAIANNVVNKLQTGGAVGGGDIAFRSRQQALQRQVERAKGPKVQVVPTTNRSPSKAHNPGAQNQPPVLNAYPSNSVAMDLANRTSIGGVF